MSNAQGAEQLRAGAIVDFNNTNVIVLGGMLTDELTNANTDRQLTSTDTRFLLEESAHGGGSGDGDVAYATLQLARIQASLAIAALRATPPANARAQVAQLFAIEGYTELFLAETYCAGTALGTVAATGDIAHGMSLTTDSLLGVAQSTFDSALVLGADSAKIASLARVGLARVLLDRNRPRAAADTVRSVPLSFVYTMDYDATHPNLWGFEVGGARAPFWTMGDTEGGNGLPFVSAHDPRLPTYSPGVGEDGTTILAFPAMYDPSGTSAIPIASGVEARLIIAEAALAAGNAAAWTDSLNALRTDSGIAPLTADSTTGAALDTQVSVMFRERAFWLYGTGHRLGDLRRLVRQYGRDQSVVFPTGPYAGPTTGISGSAVYGTSVNFPIPAAERQNPYFHGCLNRNA